MSIHRHPSATGASGTGSPVPASTHTVLLTRPADPSGDDRFSAALAAHGIRTLHEPFIDILPPEDWEAVDAALDALPVYSGVALTSANAARYFFGRMAERGIGARELPPVFAVGEKTAAAARERGAEVDLVPDSATGADLAAALGDVSNQFILHPAANIARKEFAEAVEARGGRVNTVTVYRTVQADRARMAELERRLVEGEIDCVAFFSPSAVRAFAAMFPVFKQATLLTAAIGHTTASAAMANGLRVDVIAPEASADSLAEAIAARLRSDQRVDLDPELHSDVA